ncbi:hypothetical protein HK405_003061, partial [Cladochytrium tenue]
MLAIEELKDLLKEIAKDDEGRKTSVEKLQGGLEEIGKRMTGFVDCAVSDESKQKVTEFLENVKAMTGDGKDPLSENAEWRELDEYKELIKKNEMDYEKHVLGKILLTGVEVNQKVTHVDQEVTELNQTVARIENK